ncbi:MAG: hypothetical protein OEZ37_09335, partial [Gemmatimonadota bacterium]|nr:hypothetical protein [Gemmatimonadota bacterium]
MAGEPLHPGRGALGAVYGACGADSRRNVVTLRARGRGGGGTTASRAGRSGGRLRRRGEGEFRG